MSVYENLTDLLTLMWFAVANVESRVYPVITNYKY